MYWDVVLLYTEDCRLKKSYRTTEGILKAEYEGKHCGNMIYDDTVREIRA